MKQYVIIGNGVAACGCIEGIRSVDKESSITVVSKENYPVYGRPLISYYLEGYTTIDKMYYRQPDFYETNQCKVLYGVEAKSLNPESKEILLSDGSKLKYDKLCVASGSSPFVPPFEGLETVEKKHTFMTIDDSLELEKDLTKDSNVLIIGAGLIGLKCAEGILNRVKKITVCDMADRVLSSIMDEKCASMVQTHLEEKGIEFILSDSVKRFEGNKAYFNSERTEEFDCLVLAVGVRANTGFVKDAKALVNRGIVVDTSMKTSLEDVYAAGDCTESYDSSSGTNKVMAILPNAYFEGKCAGENMAGKDTGLENEIPMNSIGFFGFHTMSAGSYYTEESGGKEYVFEEKDSLRKFYTKDGVMTGFILINATDKAGIYTGLIRNKVKLDTVDWESLLAEPKLFAFSRAYRDEVLANKKQSN